MAIDLSASEEAIFSGFSRRTQRYIRQAERNLTITTMTLSKEKNDDMFVLFYAFLKDSANAKRFQIPVYRDMLPVLRAYKKRSSLLFAYEGKTPIAVLWIAEHASATHFMQLGSVRRGYATHADYLLVWEAIKEARRARRSAFSFKPLQPERFPGEILLPSDLIEDFGGSIQPDPTSPTLQKFFTRVFAYLR
jgi:hypothetical protein